MPSTNFQIFNEANDAATTYNDSEYTNATQRQTGVVPGMAISRMHNKMYMQWSVMCKAVADFIVSKGYDCMDNDEQAIAQNLSDIIAAAASDLGYLLRKNSTAYAVGDIAFSASLPSYLVLECTTPGTTAASEPDFSGAVEKDTVTDGTVVWTYRNILSGNGGGVQVGFIMPYAGTGLAEGWLDCDGSAVSRTMYPDLFDAIGTTWGAGDGSTTFNLPRSEDLVFQGASATNPVGTYKTAGLPNIEGEFDRGNTGFSGIGQYESNFTTGALYPDSTAAQSGLAQSFSPSGGGYPIAFDASRSNTIYGASDTVQPPAACVRYMIKAFDGQTPDSALIDITQYAADLANKATRSLDNLTPTGEARFAHVVVDSYYDSTTGDWWREYADGWIEQGGLLSPAGGSGTITLLKPMEYTNYTVSMQGYDPGGNQAYPAQVDTVTSTTFTWFSSSNHTNLMWSVTGQGASA